MRWSRLHPPHVAFWYVGNLKRMHLGKPKDYCLRRPSPYTSSNNFGGGFGAPGVATQVFPFPAPARISAVPSVHSCHEVRV